MKVRMKMFANLQEISGTGEVLIDAETVLAAIEMLVSLFPKLTPEIFDDFESRRLRSRVKVMVNGRDIDYLEGLGTGLREGDRVAVFPILAGG